MKYIKVLGLSRKRFELSYEENEERIHGCVYYKDDYPFKKGTMLIDYSEGILQAIITTIHELSHVIFHDLRILDDTDTFHIILNSALEGKLETERIKIYFRIVKFCKRCGAPCHGGELCFYCKQKELEEKKES